MRVVDLFGEERARADPRERHVVDDVSRGPDLDPLRRRARRGAAGSRTHSVCHSASALPRVPIRERAATLICVPRPPLPTRCSASRVAACFRAGDHVAHRHAFADTTPASASPGFRRSISSMISLKRL